LARGLLSCPVCNSELVAARFTGVEVMHCSQCEGYWVQKKRLGEILDRYMRRLAERHDKKHGQKRVNPWKVEKVRLVCPGCGRAMTKLNYAYNSNVLVDRCPACEGTWLDKGEIEKIAEFFKYHGLPDNFWEGLRQIQEIYKKHGSDGGEDLCDYDCD
jgi:Zn-finger nucleic acid-binding protein